MSINRIFSRLGNIPVDTTPIPPQNNVPIDTTPIAPQNNIPIDTTPIPAVGPGALPDTTRNMLIAILDIICQVFLYLGIALMVWGIIMWGQSFASENAEKQNSAMWLIVSGILLCCLKIVAAVILRSVGFVYPI